MGDHGAKVGSLQGLLAPFCCDALAFTQTANGGKLAVLVDNASQRVVQIIGCDEEFWSRSIAD